MVSKNKLMLVDNRMTDWDKLEQELISIRRFPLKRSPAN